MRRGIRVPPPISLIKQERGSLNCCACCAAMLTGHTVEEVHAWLGNQVGEPMHDSELHIWALRNEWFPAVGFHFGEGGDLSGSLDEIRLQCEYAVPRTHRLYMAVQSRTNPEWTHAVLWAEGRLFDPHPDAPEIINSLDGYKVFDVIPFIYDERGYVPESVIGVTLGPRPTGALPDHGEGSI